MKDIDSDALLLLKKEVEDKMGYSLKAPTNFDALISRVEREINETLSLSTVKRLWGYVTSTKSPRLSTLSILSRFLGYRDYDDFCIKKHIFVSEDSYFITKSGEITTNISVGDELSLEWEPDRFCRIKCEGKDKYRVVKAINCKLHEGDTFCASFFAVGHPLYVSELIRDEKRLSNYVAGKTSGITSIDIKRFNEI